MDLDKKIELADKGRRSFYSSLGTVSTDVLALGVNDASFGGATPWPVGPAWRTIRRKDRLILASDGLSAPMEGADIGFGVEVYIETKSPDILQKDIYTGIAVTWFFCLLSGICDIVAGHHDFRSLFMRHGILTAEVNGASFPEHFKNDQGHVGVLLGAPAEKIPSGFDQFDKKVRFIPVTVLNAEETDYLTEVGTAEKHRFANALKQRRFWHYSDLDRPSLIRSGVLHTSDATLDNAEAERLYFKALQYVDDYAYGAALTVVDEALKLEENAYLLCLKGELLMYDDQEVETAIQAFDSAISSAPGYYKPYLEKGKYHHNENDFDTANDLFVKAVERKPSVETSYWLGKNQIARGHMQAAVQQLTRAVDLIDTTHQYDYDIDPLCLRASCYLKINQPEKAIRDLSKALEISNKNWRVFRDLVKAYEAMEAFDTGIETCERYISVDPSEAFQRMAELHLKQGHHEKALATMDRWMNANPDDARDIHIQKSRIYMDMERFEEAVACMDTLIANPEEQWYVFSGDYKERADILELHLKDPIRAQACYDDAIERFPDEYQPIVRKAEFLAGNNRREEAVTLLETLLASASDRNIDGFEQYQIYLALADNQRALGQHAAAISACNRALLAEPEYNTGAYIKKAQCHADNGDYAAAVKVFDEGLERHDKEWFRLKKANALKEWEQYDAALEAYDAVIEKKPDDDESYFNKGLIFQHLGDDDRAVAAFNRVLAIHTARHISNDDTLGARINRGISYANLGLTDSAMADYDHVIAHENYKNRHIAFFNRGKYHYAMGNFDQACKDWETAYALKPDYENVLTDLPELYIVTREYKKAVTMIDTCLSGQTDARLLTILLFLKAVALRQLGRLEDAKECEVAFGKTAAQYSGEFYFTIKHLLNYLSESETDKQHLRELGACFE